MANPAALSPVARSSFASPSPFDLPLRERNALLLRAGYAPAYSKSSFQDVDVSAVREALGMILTGHEPYPAMIVNRAGELILG